MGLRCNCSSGGDDALATMRGACCGSWCRIPTGRAAALECLEDGCKRAPVIGPQTEGKVARLGVACPLHNDGAGGQLLRGHGQLASTKHAPSRPVGKTVCLGPMRQFYMMNI